MTATNLDVYTPEWADRHFKSYSTKLHTDYVVSIIKKLQVRSILDIGCASGHLINSLTDKGYDATGLDIVESNIRYAKRHCWGHYVYGDPYKLKVLNYKYDLIVVSHILEHLDDPTAYLLELKPLLKPGGKILAITPNAYSYSDRSLWRQNRCYVIWDKYHVRTFIPENLQTTVRLAGYKIISVNTHTYRGNIIGGLISTTGRIAITKKRPSIKDKPLVSKATGDKLERLYAAMPSGILDRLSERNNKGSDIVVIASN